MSSALFPYAAIFQLWPSCVCSGELCSAADVMVCAAVVYNAWQGKGRHTQLLFDKIWGMVKAVKESFIMVVNNNSAAGSAFTALVSNWVMDLFWHCAPAVLSNLEIERVSEIQTLNRPRKEGICFNVERTFYYLGFRSVLTNLSICNTL